jgi:hypothetical protein
MWKGHLLPTIHLQRLVLTTLYRTKKVNRLRVEQLKLELARNEADHIRKLATLEKRVTGLKETVANQRNRISKLEADRKATETELKAKLR